MNGACMLDAGSGPPVRMHGHAARGCVHPIPLPLHAAQRAEERQRLARAAAVMRMSAAASCCQQQATMAHQHAERKGRGEGLTSFMRLGTSSAMALEMPLLTSRWMASAHTHGAAWHGQSGLRNGQPCRRAGERN